LYAAMWEHRRLPDYFESGGKSSGLFKTSDGGKTWNKVSGNGFPTSNLGRIAVAIAPSNNNFIYLTVECEKKEEKGLYRSEDAGATWKKISSEFVITVRPFYFARLVVDPTNHKKLYKCSFIAGISEDGGESFRSIDGNVHADSHAFWISEKNPNTVFVGTDGGAYRSDDGGKVFEMCKDLPLSQFYHVAVDNETPFNVYGGLQDNGSWYAPSQAAGGIQNKHWEVTCYGDGFKSYPHPADNNIVYSESQEGNIVRFNKRDGQLKDIRPIEPSREEPKYRFNWNSPIYISPTNPERLYFACQYLFLSTNRGDSWTKISSDLTTNTPTRQRQKSSGGYTRENTGAEMNTTVYTIAENRLDANTIWVGTDDGNVQVTTNGGKNWADVTKNIQGLPQYTWCSHVEASRFDKNAAYAVFDGHRTGDKKPYIFKTTDLGKTWTSLASADIDAYAITIKEDSKSPNVLFLGTEFGMFISVDGGQGWKRFTNNLPKTSVQYLAIQERDDALAIATHGRGIYIIDDISPLRELTAEVLAKDFHFFNIKPGELNLERFSEPYGGSGMYRGENPDRTVKINYFMKKRHTFGKMGVEVYDESGKLVKELPAGKNAGINIVQLPLRLPMAKAAPTLNIQALGGGIFPPTLPEGKYTVKVKKGAEEYTTQVSLGYDKIAAAAYPLADRQLAHKTLMRLYEITNQLGYMYYAMKDMQEAAQKLGKDSTDRAFAKQCNTFADSVAAYKDGLVALEGDGYTDSGTNLREEISNLYGGVSRYPGKPSDGQVSKTTYYEGEIEKVKTKFNHFVAEMTKLNTTIAQLQKTPIKIKTFEEYMK
ncbi:MAG: hypothetical protein KA974_11990, partial [Saprospiraceae bacterium]|nr:hypothetical protein [Saprospiraceae bacterium]